MTLCGDGMEKSRLMNACRLNDIVRIRGTPFCHIDVRGLYHKIRGGTRFVLVSHRHILIFCRHIHLNHNIER